MGKRKGWNDRKVAAQCIEKLVFHNTRVRVSSKIIVHNINLIPLKINNQLIFSSQSNWIEKLKVQKLDGDKKIQAKLRDEVMCIESIDNLVFNQDKNCVEYAYYKSGENQRIGYIRLQPNVVKKLCKSKQYHLVS